MANNEKGYRMLVDLRNQLIFNQINFKEFLKQLEIILFNYISVNSVKMAGGNYLYCYTTIARRLLSDEIGQRESLENLKIDLTY